MVTAGTRLAIGDPMLKRTNQVLFVMLVFAIAAVTFIA
jgi:hypothetical protein